MQHSANTKADISADRYSQAHLLQLACGRDVLRSAWGDKLTAAILRDMETCWKIHRRSMLEGFCGTRPAYWWWRQGLLIPRNQAQALFKMRELSDDEIRRLREQDPFIF